MIFAVGLFGETIAYSALLGGGIDRGAGIAVDAGGHAHVAETTSSPDFPTTPSAFQQACRGGCRDPVFDDFLSGFVNPGAGEMFVARLSSDGSALLYSTYLGGTGGDSAAGLALDAGGNVYVTGSASEHTEHRRHKASFSEVAAPPRVSGCLLPPAPPR